MTIKRVHNDVHLIADDVHIPLTEAERAETERALAVIERIRSRALKAMHDQDCDLADRDDEKVVFAFDYRIENDHVIVQVAQVAE